MWAKTSTALTRSVPAALAILAAVAAPVAAQPPTALTLHAVTGADQQPVAGAELTVASCGPEAAPALNLTTGGDGSVTAPVAPGCYRVEVVAVPSGCMFDGEPVTRIDVAPGATSDPVFRFHCA